MVYLAILILLLSNQVLFAQWNFKVSLDQEYNDNPFRLPAAEYSWITSAAAGLEKEFDKCALGYYGTYSQFYQLPSRDFYWHQVAFWGGSDTTSWGFYAEQQINKREFNIYNYKELNGYFNHRFVLYGINSFWHNHIQLNSFDLYTDLNNLKVSSTISFQKSFSSKTTIISRIGVDFKNYLRSSQHLTMMPDSMISQMSVATNSIMNLLSNGDGGMMGNANKGSGRGYLHGEGGGFFASNSYVNFEQSSAAQLLLWLRIAQSITPTTGLALHYSNRMLLTGADRFISGISYNYRQESGIFNDPMGYESHSLGLEITKILPLTFALKLSAQYLTKDFSSQGIYANEETYVSEVLRNDKYKSGAISLKKDFGFSNRIMISLNLNYQLLKNESNSYWYNFKNSFSSIGLSFSL